MAILPADAHIGNVKEFQRALELCFEAAENQDIIVCLGIKPTFSATGFGYIKVGPHLSQDLYKIDSFVEKPNSEKAEEFFRGGQHLWNAGIFVFKISTFKNQVQQHAHDFFKFFNKTSLKAVGFKKQFKKLPKLPVDVALMEKTKSGALVVGDFGWNDLGSWPALAEVLPLNRDESLIQSSGGEFSLKSSKNIVHLESKKFLALIGIKNLIIVETPQAILVADQSHAQDIKEVVSHLQSKKKYSKLL
jgi:mannose-1-phosphate guanylyltransferase